MRRFGSLVWMLGSVMAASAALVVTFAHAAPRSSGSDADAWSKDEMAVLASLSLKRLPPLPVDPSNAVERLPAAVDLGRRLFSDARFSRNGAVSCASCHDPQKQFQDGLPVGRGVGTGSRRSMPIVGAGYSTWLFWDGRKDSLWAQALGPLEDEVKHGGNRTRHAQLLASNYRKEYEALFNAMPQREGLPQDAGRTAARPRRRPGPRWTPASAKTCHGCSRTWARPSRRMRSRCSTSLPAWTATSMPW
jgi:cytochrome c peroxidase